jgi:DNA-binding CsgD family transcriptional regulator
MDRLSLSTIVEDLYAGTLDDAAWAQALLGIADRVRACAAVLLAFNPSTGAVLRAESYRLDPWIFQNYRDYWSYQDPRIAAAEFIPVGLPMTEVTLPIPAWSQTPILNEFLLPGDVPHFMPVWLRKTDTKVVALSLPGTRKRGPFDAQDQEAFRLLAPHVSRALEIRDRLEAANIRTDSLASCIERTHFGVITLTADRKMLDLNAAAERMLQTEKSIRTSSDRRLHLPEPAASHLCRWLASRSRGKEPAQYLTRIQRGPGRPPISVLMNPVPQRPLRWVSVDPVCILFLFDPEREVRAEPARVAAELGISAREAELAALLASGLELSNVAQRLRISIHTARTHLKAIYAKTGIGSQAELARRICMGLCCAQYQHGFASFAVDSDRGR